MKIEEKLSNIDKIILMEKEKAIETFNDYINNDILKNKVILFIKTSSFPVIWQHIFCDVPDMNLQIEIDDIIRGD
jgi:hypothetical protein